LQSEHGEVQFSVEISGLDPCLIDTPDTLTLRFKPLNHDVKRPGSGLSTVINTNQDYCKDTDHKVIIFAFVFGTISYLKYQASVTRNLSIYQNI